MMSKPSWHALKVIGMSRLMRQTRPVLRRPTMCLPADRGYRDQERTNYWYELRLPRAKMRRANLAVIRRPCLQPCLQSCSLTLW